MGNCCFYETKHPSQPAGVTYQPQILPPPPPPPEPEPLALAPIREVACATFPYTARNVKDLSFEQGDFMYIISKQSDWWKAEHAQTRQVGYIPSNYVSVDKGPTSLEAWFDIGRCEAERRLLMMGNPTGSYLIRPSSDQRFFALSIRYYEEAKNMWCVRHFQIRTMDGNRGYYISATRTFPVISDLIRHYQTSSDGLCCRLTLPVPREFVPPIQFDALEVNRESLTMMRKLGQGSFGEVWLGKWNKMVEVAIKTLRPNSMSPEKFLGEARMMHKLHHPRIVQILGICTLPEDAPIFIITELMAKGALLDFLRGQEGRTVEFGGMIGFIAQIAEGMAYLETKKFVHRDLRAANILVSEQYFVKVADFGLAHITDDEVYCGNDETKFPIRWTAPEALQRRQFSIKSDIWSFGILIYEVITYGQVPYAGWAHREVVESVIRGERLSKPDVVAPGCDREKLENLYGLMQDCWKARSEDRPTFEYLSGLFKDWDVSTQQQYHENE